MTKYIVFETHKYVGGLKGRAKLVELIQRMAAEGYERLADRGEFMIFVRRNR